MVHLYIDKMSKVHNQEKAICGVIGTFIAKEFIEIAIGADKASFRRQSDWLKTSNNSSKTNVSTSQYNLEAQIEKESDRRDTESYTLLSAEFPFSAHVSFLKVPKFGHTKMSKLK